MESLRYRLSVLIIASLFVWVSCQKEESSPAHPPETKTAGLGEAPLKMKKIRANNYDETGLAWVLEAPEAEGYPEKNLFKALDMTIHVYDRGKKSADIQADKGIFNTVDPKPGTPKEHIEVEKGLYLDPGDMYLTGNVVVVSTDGTKLETDWLTYYMSRDLIKSTAPVTVNHPDSVIYGTGFEATPDLSKAEIYNETVVIREQEPAEEKREDEGVNEQEG